MATLAFNHEEITARELKPVLLDLHGISRETVEAHYKLYEGYVNKRNEIMGKLAEIDLASANQVYSEVRGLKVELSFALGGIKKLNLKPLNPASSSSAAACLGSYASGCTAGSQYGPFLVDRDKAG